MTKFTDTNGTEWISNDMLIHGDYCGGGALAKANQKVILEEIAADPGAEYCDLPGSWYDAEAGRIEIAPEIRAVMLYEGFGSRLMFLRSTDPAWEELEMYPVLSEDLMCEIEMEEVDEAWESWAQADAWATVDWEDLGVDEYDRDALAAIGAEWTDEPKDWVERLFGEGWDREAFEAARESVNEYWEADGPCGQHIRVERVAPAFLAVIKQEVDRKARVDLEAAGQLALPVALPETRIMGCWA